MADVGKGFESLPIGQLICTPLLAVAQGQAELCRVYLDHLFKLAFVNGKPGDGATAVRFFVLTRCCWSPETASSDGIGT